MIDEQLKWPIAYAMQYDLEYSECEQRGQHGLSFANPVLSARLRREYSKTEVSRPASFFLSLNSNVIGE